MSTIFDLPAVGSPVDTDIFWAQDAAGTTDYKYTRAQIVAQVASDLATEIATTDAEITNLQNDKLDKAGGTMTGLLTLSGAPSSALHAATKTYVDTADALKADLASPTFTGTPAAPTAADGTSTTQIATTAFVVNQLDEYIFERTSVTGATASLTEDQAGIIGVNRVGAVTLTLPQISSLTNPQRVFYVIKDEGFNANATTQVITINRAGTDTIENSGTSLTITTAGEGLHLYNDGTSKWFVANVDTTASETSVGVVELATSAETTALTDTTRVVTPATLSDVLDQEVYKASELGAASKVMTEADAGTWYVTYTATGSVSITLPNPATLTDPTKCVFEIVDTRNASTNNITVTSGGSATLVDGSSSSFVIDQDYMGIKFFTDGTDWFATNNTQTAVDNAVAAAAVAASPLTSKGDIYTYSTTDAKLSVGTDGFALLANSAESTGLKWTDLSLTYLPLAGGTMTGAITMSPDIKLEWDATNYLVWDNAVTGDTILRGDSIQVRVADYSHSINNSGEFQLRNTAAATFGTLQWAHTGGSDGNLTPATLAATRNWTLPDTDGNVTVATSSAPIKTNTINIGDWDMDANSSVSVNHGLSATEWKTVRGIDIIVRDDADAAYYQLDSIDDNTSGLTSGGVKSISSTQFILQRYDTGKFDGTDFDSTSYNRGWITFEYTPD